MGTALWFALATIAGAALYALGYKGVEVGIDILRDRGLLFKKIAPNLSGTWYAVWETSAEGQDLLSTEVIEAKQRVRKLTFTNREVSPENPHGGFMWKGNAILYDNTHILGTYRANDPNVLSKGTLYFQVHRNGSFMVGKWVGCNYDSDFTWGLAVLARNPKIAENKIKALLRGLPQRPLKMLEDEPRKGN